MGNNGQRTGGRNGLNRPKWLCGSQMAAKGRLGQGSRLRAAASNSGGMLANSLDSALGSWYERWQHAVQMSAGSGRNSGTANRNGVRLHCIRRACPCNRRRPKPSAQIKGSVFGFRFWSFPQYFLVFPCRTRTVYAAAAPAGDRSSCVGPSEQRPGLIRRLIARLSKLIEFPVPMGKSRVKQEGPQEIPCLK